MVTEYEPGMEISSYQLALVIILVLNLLFWLIVIIWRFCYLKKLNAVVERRRAEMRGRINDGLDSEQRSPEDDIYSLSRGDFPPSYDDAIKSHPIFPPPEFDSVSNGAQAVRPRTSTPPRDTHPKPMEATGGVELHEVLTVENNATASNTRTEEQQQPQQQITIDLTDPLISDTPPPLPTSPLPTD